MGLPDAESTWKVHVVAGKSQQSAGTFEALSALGTAQKAFEALGTFEALSAHGSALGH